MKLSELQSRSSFALLGPGFTGAGFALLEGLAPSQRPQLLFAPFEARRAGFESYLGSQSLLERLEFDVEPARLDAALDAPDHAARVEEIRQAIAAGDVYQVCLTARASLGRVEGARLFSTMCSRGVPRFAAWVRFPDGREIVSASPERFFEIRGGRVTSEPMKGTARAGATGDLQMSEKDCAELAMITDLVRNDLTPICEPRSVEVLAARKFIELPYAVQAVSEISGRLLPETTVTDVLAALHPGGSVTGAPKGAALEMIRRLEPTPRGAYCGALGLCGDERAVFSLLIRTAESLGARGWRYGVGGGIVIDSDPVLEYDELRIKLEALACAGRL